MPKDEFDLDDPLELNGVGIVCEEDTTEAMTECFVEEFMRLGHNHKQILAMFRNPHYLGMNMALQNRGEPFVRDAITEVFARWGRPVKWPDDNQKEASTGNVGEAIQPAPTVVEREGQPAACSGVTDPMGAPVPDISI